MKKISDYRLIQNLFLSCKWQKYQQEYIDVDITYDHLSESWTNAATKIKNSNIQFERLET
jgi:hypothetical protein